MQKNKKQKSPLESISTTISYILRHHPEEFGLSLDEYGWVSVDKLLTSLNNHLKKYSPITKETIIEIMNSEDKQRYELVDNKIRAIYGHSYKEIPKTPSEPPEILYHGTSHKSSPIIEKEGLKKMDRKRVCLSEDIETAITVGKRRDNNPIIFKVKAKEASKNGIKFFREINGVWESDDIPPQYLMV